MLSVILKLGLIRFCNPSRSACIPYYWVISHQHQIFCHYHIVCVSFWQQLFSTEPSCETTICSYPLVLVCEALVIDSRAFPLLPPQWLSFFVQLNPTGKSKCPAWVEFSLITCLLPLENSSSFLSRTSFYKYCWFFPSMYCLSLCPLIMFFIIVFT